MTTEKIAQCRPVQFADDAVLFLWATAPKLEDALHVMKAWGFRYRTHAVWDKMKIGMGYYFRGQHELLLVGTRGIPGAPSPSDRASSVFRFERGKHSRKPEGIRDVIELMYPNATRIELFARERSDGWDAWGNEV